MAVSDLTKIAGPMLIGYLLNWGLFGALSIQLFFYYLSFPNDRWDSKLLIGVVYVLEAVQVVMLTSDCFQTYVVNYGNIESLDDIRLEGVAVPVFTSIVSCAVQLFYAYRLFLLSRNWYTIVAVCVLSLAQLVAGFYVGVAATIIDTFSGIQESRGVQICIAFWLGGGALCDILITASMMYLLLHAHTSNRATHNSINRLVRVVIETGMLTSIMALVSLILYYAFPEVPFHTPAAEVLSKLYSNSALAIFNSRIHIVGGREPTNPSTSMHISISPDAVAPLTRHKIRSKTRRSTPIRFNHESVYAHSGAVQLEEMGSPRAAQSKQVDLPEDVEGSMCSASVHKLPHAL